MESKFLLTQGERFAALVFRSLVSQIADHQARSFVDKPRRFLIAEEIRSAQDCRMGQRFHNCYEDEGSEIEIGDINLISMCLEIGSNQCITLLLESLDFPEPSNMWDLFRKDAMELGIDAMTVDCN